MVCEYDKFIIPEKYLRMSASERKRLEEEELRKMREKREKNKTDKYKKLKESPVKFNI